MLIIQFLIWTLCNFSFLGGDTNHTMIVTWEDILEERKKNIG